MHSPRLLRGLAALVALLFVATAAVAVLPTARAAANAPRWSAGDSWVYVDQDNNLVRVDVIGKDPVLGFDTFRVTESATSGSITVTTNEWIRDTDIGLAQTSVSVFGTTSNTTYNPPESFADFPLSTGKSWSKSSDTQLIIGGRVVSTGTLSYSATVEAEFDQAVPAGTFHVFVIRMPTPFGYTKYYYSDSAGYWVKVETYNSQNTKTGERNLTSYRYQAGNLLTYVLIGVVAVIAVVVILALWAMRKRAVGRPGGPAPPRRGSPYQPPAQWPEQPGYPPQQPPRP